jgi:hypothetical protein
MCTGELGGRDMQNPMEKLVQSAEARRKNFFNELVAELRAKGHTIEREDVWWDDSEIRKIDGEYLSVVINNQRTGSGAFSRTNGKLSLRIVKHKWRKKFYPEPKNGFDLKKTVERIEKVLEDAKWEAELKDRQKRVDAITSNFHMEVMDRVKLQGVSNILIEKDSMEKVKVTLHLTEEELHKVCDALRKEL